MRLRTHDAIRCHKTQLFGPVCANGRGCSCGVGLLPAHASWRLMAAAAAATTTTTTHLLVGKPGLQEFDEKPVVGCMRGRQGPYNAFISGGGVGLVTHVCDTCTKSTLVTRVESWGRGPQLMCLEGLSKTMWASTLINVLKQSTLGSTVLADAARTCMQSKKRHLQAFTTYAK